MIRMIRWAAAVMAVGLALPMAVHATPTSYDLSFQTSGQSIWGSGSSFTLDQTKFIGAQWQNKTAGIRIPISPILPVPPMTSRSRRARGWVSRPAPALTVSLQSLRFPDWGHARRSDPAENLHLHVRRQGWSTSADAPHMTWHSTRAGHLVILPAPAATDEAANCPSSHWERHRRQP